MVSGKPPRHSKSSAEPVTIDLDAKDVKKLGTDKDAAPTDAASTARPDESTSVASSSPVDAPKENPRPIWEEQVKTPIEPEPNIHKTGDVKAAEQGPTKTSSVPPLKAEAPKAATHSEPLKTDTAKPASDKTSSGSTPSASRSATENRAGNSGLVAAGIVGGLIALLAAGSMQYAGYLPPFTSNGGSSDELTALETQLASLREQVANAPQATGDTSSLEARIAALESSASSGGDDVASKLAALEGTVSTLQSEKATQDTATADLTRRLSEAETKINEPRDDIEVARAIASAGLKAAIDRGGPFLSELDTLSRVTPDDPAVRSLRPFANTGVPSRAELTHNFPDVANVMLDSLNQADPNQGVLDRLTQSALSLVKVRPVGNIEGEGADAKIARIEDKLRNGDLKGAALEWDGLPEPAKATSTEFKKSLDARVEVEDLVNGTLTRAITSTGKQG